MMKFNDYSDEETCGKRVPGEISDRYADLGGIACVRTQGHAAECIATAGDAGAADGVHWCCRTKLDLDHHARCVLREKTTSDRKEGAVITSSRSDTDEETLKFKTPRVLGGQHVRCVNRPQHPPFLWQRFEITNPELWTIFNVAIGNRSLFKQNPGGGAGISAQRLNEEGLLCKDVCRVAQDFSIEAMYIGPDPEGTAFECDVIGRVPR